MDYEEFMAKASQEQLDSIRKMAPQFELTFEEALQKWFGVTTN